MIFYPDFVSFEGKLAHNDFVGPCLIDPYRGFKSYYSFFHIKSSWVPTDHSQKSDFSPSNFSEDFSFFVTDQNTLFTSFF